MLQNYPSVQIPTKELRLFLRRINKIVKDLEDSPIDAVADDVLSSQISNLIIKKATEMKSVASDNLQSDEFSEILNELI